MAFDPTDRAFRPIICRALTATALLLALTCAGAPAKADVLFTNFPGNNGIGNSIGNEQAIAVGFDPLFNATIDSFTVEFYITSLGSEPAGDATVSLYNSVAGAPGSVIASLTGPSSFVSGYSNYTYSPSSPLALTAGDTYWFTIEWSGGIGLQWESSFPTFEPYTTNGIGYVKTDIAATVGNGWNEFTVADFGEVTPNLAINGTVSGAPEPAAFALAGLALCGLGLLRRRAR